MPKLLIREGVLDRLKESRGIQTDAAMASMGQVSVNTYKSYRDRKATPSSVFLALICAGFGMGIGELAEVVPDTAAMKASA